MKTLLSEDTLVDGVRQLANQINEDFGDRPLTVVGVMTGCIVLLSDMIRQLRMPLRVGVIQASSYRDSTNSGQLVVNSELLIDISQRDVLVLDDIFDTGRTMVELVATMKKLGANSVKTGVLLVKEGQQQVDYRPDYVGFEIPNEFVVGYGLDYRDEYRNLPFLAALEEHEINAAVK